ncbi:hypothetical protein FKM82_013495 [Ascaphus truei]
MKSFEFLILGSLFGFVTADSLKIRLVEGNTSCNGRLEVHHNGEWGTVCDDQWDRLDSKVVCKELGCGSPKFIYNCDKFREGSGPIWLDEVNCTGREPSLSECKANAHGVHDCTHSEDVGVGCKENFKLRLVDGPDNCTGRLEVYHDGEWGSVCDDDWDRKDAQVVCSELKCGSSQPYKARSPRFGQATGRIWLDDVQCNGEEESLEKCKHRIWAYNDCTHKEDVSVFCTGPLTA